MARRGFFAELQHQSRVAARDRERAQKQAVRQQLADARDAERARNEVERARIQLAKATATEAKRLEKEARDAYIAAKEAEAVELNGALIQVYEEIDSMLVSTLNKDDYVDLNALRIVATHPTFDRTDLEVPIAPLPPMCVPPKPIFEPPTSPTFFANLFGKKKFGEAVERAQLAHKQAVKDWHAKCQNEIVCRQKAEEAHSLKEASRLAALASEQERYSQECAEREDEATEQNRALEELIANLGYGTADAVQEYVSIVLSNSVYPENFQVSHEFEFDTSTAELRLNALVPGPSAIPEIKSYKYSKSTDEITASSLTQKDVRDRYAGAIHQVALRSFHEVFEADRRGLIRTISLEIGTNTVDPATGQPTYVPFVIAASERDTFLTFDLSAVVPGLTLGRLGASVSKNPYNLVAADRSGVRRS